MDQAFSRTALLLGAEAMEKLHKARVIVFGLGGVGGHACEALVRSGVGAIDLVDDDQVAESNLNRQLFATRSTIGMDKTEAAKLRLLDINPDLKITTHKCFFLPETADRFDFTQYDYIVDAIDTVTGKIALAEAADRAGTPIISSMGAGNKLDPTAFEGRLFARGRDDAAGVGRARPRGTAQRPREHRVRAVCGGADPRRRGCEGSRGGIIVFPNPTYGRGLPLPLFALH